MLKSFFDTLFPPHCAVCHTRGDSLCQSCLDSFPRASVVQQEAIQSLFDYHDEGVKKALWALKFKKVRDVAEPMGKALGDLLLEDIADIRSIDSVNPIFVIPIPLGRKRRQERGYNQSELIARSAVAQLSSQTNTTLADMLMRSRETVPQSTLPYKAKRLRNVRGCFQVKKTSLIAGSHVLVIDDICTTGATLNEAMTTLKKAGAQSVTGYAIAH